MESFVNFFKDKINKENALKIIVILGLLGIGLILISELIPKQTEEKTENKSNSSVSEADEYRKDMEEKLTEILSKIDGVGDLSVMLTVSCTEEYVYAEEIKDSISTDTEKQTSQNENSVVIIDAGDEKEALVKKVINPQINGVVIVCEGGGSAKVCESIYRSVSIVLDIPTNKIYVTKIKQP